LKLLPFQTAYAEHVGTVLAKNHGALLAAATGVGKTYIAASIIKEFKACGIEAAVICPKIAIPNWQKVLHGFGVDDTPVINYEKARTRWVNWSKTREKWPTWKSEFRGRLIVFDESHRCGGKDSLNAKMLGATKGAAYSLQMSATPADNPMRMRAMALSLGLIPSWSSFWSWARAHGCLEDGWGGLQFTKSERKGAQIMSDMNTRLFPNKGQLVTVDDCAEYFDVWDQVLEEFEQKCFVNRQQVENYRLAMRARARSEVEKLKVPVLAEMAQDAMDCGYSVPIFLNFTEPILALAEKLKVPAIWGGDNAVDRAAGAEAVSLHDLVGNRPRLSLINPSDLGTAIAQVLGRVHRVGAKSPATQKLILAADSVEEQVAANLNRKLGNLGALTDSDLRLI